MPETTERDAEGRLEHVIGHADGFQLLYERLAAPADRELLIRVLAFRILGHRRVRLPITADQIRQLTSRACRMRIAERTAPFGVFDWFADDFDLSELNLPLRIRTVPEGIVYNFLLDQYRCGGVLDVGVRPGDVVIDGGAFAGDTALYFAHLAGAGGRVFAFEFEPRNLELLEQNLALNPAVARRVEVRRAALWDRDGRTVGYTALGPGTSIRPDGKATVETASIDALVDSGEIERVDFIKLDVEGSELRALRGARRSLRRFRPRLAIAAYHRLDDLARLPLFLADVDVGYRFRLRHVTMHHEETVLFARAG